MKGPEARWQEQVIDVARLYGWRCAHFRTAQQGGRYMTPVAADGSGFPDLVLVRERIVYAELKAAKGTLGLEQQRWRDALIAAGAEWHLWRPKHWDEVVSVLKR